MVQVEKVRLSDSTGKVKAFLDINWHGLVVKGFKVVEHEGSLFVGMPQQKGKGDDAKYYNTAFATEAVKGQLNQLGLDAYNKVIGQVSSAPGPTQEEVPF